MRATYRRPLIAVCNTAAGSLPAGNLLYRIHWLVANHPAHRDGIPWAWGDRTFWCAQVGLLSRDQLRRAVTRLRDRCLVVAESAPRSGKWLLYMRPWCVSLDGEGGGKDHPSSMAELPNYTLYIKDRQRRVTPARDDGDMRVSDIRVKPPVRKSGVPSPSKLESMWREVVVRDGHLTMVPGWSKKQLGMAARYLKAVADPKKMEEAFESALSQWGEYRRMVKDEAGVTLPQTPRPEAMLTRPQDVLQFHETTRPGGEHPGDDDGEVFDDL